MRSKFLQIVIIFSSPECYSFPLHVHILCIQYGTVLQGCCRGRGLEAQKTDLGLVITGLGLMTAVAL